MSSKARLVLAVFLGVSLIAVSTATFAAVAAWRAGSILVSVDPENPDDPAFALRVPALILPAALALVPDAAFRDVDRRLIAALPLASKACDLLERQGDAVFVEVVNARENIRIAKVGASVRIDVFDGRDEVHVAVPIAALRAVVARLERALSVDPARV
jgi:hypothetical protein